jgi:hypothetical protein
MLVLATTTIFNSILETCKHFHTRGNSIFQNGASSLLLFFAPRNHPIPDEVCIIVHSLYCFPFRKPNKKTRSEKMMDYLIPQTKYLFVWLVADGWC